MTTGSSWPRLKVNTKRSSKKMSSKYLRKKWGKSTHCWLMRMMRSSTVIQMIELSKEIVQPKSWLRTTTLSLTMLIKPFHKLIPCSTCQSKKDLLQEFSWKSKHIFNQVHLSSNRLSSSMTSFRTMILQSIHLRKDLSSTSTRILRKASLTSRKTSNHRSSGKMNEEVSVTVVVRILLSMREGILQMKSDLIVEDRSSFLWISKAFATYLPVHQDGTAIENLIKTDLAPTFWRITQKKTTTHLKKLGKEERSSLQRLRLRRKKEKWWGTCRFTKKWLLKTQRLVLILTRLIDLLLMDGLRYRNKQRRKSENIDHLQLKTTESARLLVCTTFMVQMTQLWSNKKTILLTSKFGTETLQLKDKKSSWRNCRRSE